MDGGHTRGRGRLSALKAAHVAWAALVACVLALGGLAACARNEGGATYTTLAELEDKRIGVVTGTIQATQVAERFPGARIFHFTTTPDMLVALRSHKIDAFAEADAIVGVMRQTEPELAVIEEPLSERMDVAGIFPKTDEGRALCDEYSAYIREIKQSGAYDRIIDTWLGADRSAQVPPDMDDLAATRGKLRMAVDSASFPYAYVKDGRLAGIDPAIAYGFAKSRGYALVPLTMDFGGILPAVTTGKADFSPGCFTRTEERAESVLFSEPTYEGYSVVAVLGAPAEGRGLVDAVAEGFEKTFVREGRWRLFAKGVGTTLLITVSSCVLGAALGFGLYLLRRRGGRVVVTVCDLVLRLVHGMPTVVLLMVLFYLVFGSIDLSGVIVAIVGFSLVFAVDVFGMLDSGVRAVDAGQAEAALALGYTDRSAFFRLVLPQAALHFMPSVSGSVTSLLKATSVVGYIAVQDLTKMGDIVRSATYEAFFPLVAVTALYFAIEWALGRVIALACGRLDPRRRTRERILEGGRDTGHGGRAGTSRPKAAGTDARDEGRQTAGDGDGRPMIEISHLRKEFAEGTPLEDISATIEDGDVVALIGPSGTGKSTLLRCINLLERPTSGSIVVDGTEVLDPALDVSWLRRRVGMVFQSFNLFAHLTAVENVMRPQTDVLGRSRQEACDRAMALLAKVGLQGHALKYPDELSGGQRQRVAIARALAMDPSTILLDEPTSALDPTMVGEVEAVVRDLAADGTTMLVVTHDLAFAAAVSTRVLFLDGGRVVEDGPTKEVFEHPRNEATRRFIRNLKVLEIEVLDPGFDYVGASTDIAAYCARNLVPHKLAHRLQLAFEELMQQVLAGRLGSGAQRFRAEYSPADERVYVTATYHGEPIDVAALSDDLSLRLLSGLGADLAFADRGDTHSVTLSL